MPGIYNMMDISRWALTASTRALDTISHNVANVNTDGYSRQETVLTTRAPQWSAEGWYGNGVATANVIQHVDRLLQSSVTDKASQLAYYDSRLTQLTRLENLDNESGDTGLGQAVTAFFSAWQDLSLNPESTAVRKTLVETANNLSTRFQTIDQDVKQVQRDMTGYIKGAVDEVNLACRRIAELNDKIVATETSGKTANDFRDERQRQIEALAANMNISWFEDGRGSVTVFAPGGGTLVQDNYPRPTDADPLTFVDVEGYTEKQVVLRDAGRVLGEDLLTGGNIGGWLMVRDQDIEGIQDFMGELSQAIISQVNQLHSQGVGLNPMTDVTGTYECRDYETALNSSANTLPFKDQIQAGSFTVWVYQAGVRRSYTINVDPNDHLTAVVDKINAAMNPTLNTALNPVASVEGGNKLRFQSSGGVTFAFGEDTSGLLAAMGVNTFFQGSTAGDIAVNAAILADTANIAAGRVLSTGEMSAGDSSNALDIADLKDAEVMSGGQTCNEAVITWATSLGSDIANTSDNKSFSETASNEMKNLRDQVSAVNLDEEMIKMIQFQRHYQMSAKLISVADSMLTTLLDIKK